VGRSLENKKKHDIISWAANDLVELKAYWDAKSETIKAEIGDVLFSRFFDNIHSKPLAFALKSLYKGFCPSRWLVEGADANHAIVLDNGTSALAWAALVTSWLGALNGAETKLQFIDAELVVLVSFVEHSPVESLKELHTAFEKCRDLGVRRTWDLSKSQSSNFLAFLSHSSTNTAVSQDYSSYSFSHPTKTVR